MPSQPNHIAIDIPERVKPTVARRLTPHERRVEAVVGFIRRQERLQESSLAALQNGDEARWAILYQLETDIGDYRLKDGTDDTIVKDVYNPQTQAVEEVTASTDVLRDLSNFVDFTLADSEQERMALASAATGGG